MQNEILLNSEIFHMNEGLEGSSEPSSRLEYSAPSNSSPLKKIAAEEYQYVKGVEERRSRDERSMRKEIEEELKVFRALRLRRAIEKRATTKSVSQEYANKTIKSSSIVDNIIIRRKM